MIDQARQEQVAWGPSTHPCIMLLAPPRHPAPADRGICLPPLLPCRPHCVSASAPRHHRRCTTPHAISTGNRTTCREEGAGWQATTLTPAPGMILTSYRGADTSAGIASSAAAGSRTADDGEERAGKIFSQFGTNLLLRTQPVAVGRVIVAFTPLSFFSTLVSVTCAKWASRTCGSPARAPSPPPTARARSSPARAPASAGDGMCS